jgi:polar amino acid transport system substrate-binding protein
MKKILFALYTLSILLLTPIATNAEASELTIGTIHRPPFMIKSEVAGAPLSGFSVELFDTVAKKANIDYSWREFTVFGEMIDATESSEVDASIANITITSKREKTLDYSQPIYDSGLLILTPKKSGGLSIVKLITESGILWFLLGALGVLLLIAHILWLFERNVENTRHDYFRDDYLGGVWDAFWWAFIIMTMGGFENEVPHKKLSRLVAMVWIISSLFFISTLTAKITTALTVSELNSSIQSVSDLAGKKVGAMEGPTVRGYLGTFGIKPVEYKAKDELYKDLTDGTLDAIVGDAPILQYYAQHEGAGGVVMAGEVFKPEKYGAIFPQTPRGKVLKEQFDRALIEMQEDGDYKELYNKYFGE